MNANQLINMVVRMLMRQVVGRGINAGIDAAANKMTKRNSGDPDADRQQNDDARNMAKRGKQMMRMGRRMGRF